MWRTVLAWGGVRTELAYLIAALVFGTVVVVWTPAFQTFDEQAHYLRAWSVAQGQILAGNDGTVSVPANVSTLPGDLRFIEVMREGEMYPRQIARRLLWERVSPEQTRVVTSAAPYGPVGYVPQAIGITMARIIGRSPLLGLYLGRFANLVACVLLVFLALRLVPLGKPLVAVIALFPLVVTLMGSLSVDGLLIAGWLLFVCLVLRLMTVEAISTRWLVILLVLIAPLVSLKAGYGFVAAIVLLLRPRQVGGWARYAVVAVATIAVVVGTTYVISRLGPDAAHVQAYEAATGSPVGVDSTRQLSDLVHDPLGFLRVVRTTYSGSAILMARQMVGVLGWGAVSVSDLVAFAYLGLLGLFLMQTEPQVLLWWQRLGMLGAALLTILFVTAALYVYATPYGESAAVGIQGRYFLPVLALVMFALYGIRIRRQSVRVVLIAGIAILGMLATLSLLLRVY